MIHYILLPIEERHALRREYRLRLAIITLFSVSFADVLGSAMLLPSYVYTRGQEAEVLIRQEVLQKSRRESGIEQREQELVGSQAIAKKIEADKPPVIFYDLLQKILIHKKPGISLSSFTLKQHVSTTSVAIIDVYGRATTRDTLLAFKKSLENDPAFLGVDLPLSDLAKSKNIDFNLKFEAAKKK